MVDHHARQRCPKFPDWLVGIPFSGIVQTDALLSGDESRGKVPPKHFFLRRYRARWFRFYANGQRFYLSGQEVINLMTSRQAGLT